MKIDAGLKYNNYVGAQHVKKMLTGLPFEPVNLKNININGQIRGCSGFLKNTETDRLCYITTESFFDRGRGCGLFGDPNNAVMMRTAKHEKDFSGGHNQWCAVEDIPEMFCRLTKREAF